MSAAEFVWLAYLVAVNGLWEAELVVSRAAMWRLFERWYGSEHFDRVHDIATRASPMMRSISGRA